MDPSSERGDEMNRKSSTSSSAVSEDNNGADGSRSQQRHEHARRSSGGGGLLDRIPPTSKATTKGEGVINVNDHPDGGQQSLQKEDLPRFKDQVQAAGVDRHDEAGAAGGGAIQARQFEGRAETTDDLEAVLFDEEGGGGSSRRGSGAAAAATFIPWAQNVRALSEDAGALSADVVGGDDNNNRPPARNNSPPTLTPSGNNAAEGRDIPPMVLCKHVVWAGSFLMAVVVIAVVAAVIALSGSDGSTTAGAVVDSSPSTATPNPLPTTLPPQTATAVPSKTIAPRSEIKLTASDGAAGDEFGWSVAIDGDTIVVGALWDDTENGSDSGSAYVYIRSGTKWTEQAKLVASDAAASDLFGFSVANGGDTIIIGAQLGSKENGSDSGSAYVYTRSGSVWTEQTKLTASDGAAGDWFGSSVAVGGDTIVIGAPNDATENGIGSGSAYVYTRSGTDWTEQAKLLASDGAANDYFGQSAAIDGNIIVIGAYHDDNENGSNSGSAYVFSRSGTVWIEQAKLTGSDGAQGDEFGGSVAIDGNNLVIGAIWHDTENGIWSGSAYVYIFSESVWTEQAKLTASDGAADDNFGWNVAIDGDFIVVGSPDNDVGENISESGKAYMYSLSGGAWTEQAKLVASDAAPYDDFSWGVAISGYTIVIGARIDDTENGKDSGSFYIFE